MKFPELKKKVNAFLLDEEGKISKENMLKGGIVLSAIAVGLLQSAKLVAGGMEHKNNLGHVNSLSMGENQGETVSITGIHNHHMSHASYDVYGDHSEGGWC